MLVVRVVVRLSILCIDGVFVELDGDVVMFFEGGFVGRLVF